MTVWAILIKTHTDILKMGIAASGLAAFLEKDTSLIYAVVIQYGVVLILNLLQAEIGGHK